MLETAVVFDDQGGVIHWHLPPGRARGALPDSPDLWHDVLWPNRKRLGGIAHTHPWEGDPWPSTEDVTTFRAIELALGRLFWWPVVTFDQVGYWRWDGNTYRCVANPEIQVSAPDIERLRDMSR